MITIFSEDIFYTASSLIGGEKDGLRDACFAAEKELISRLRPDVTPHDCRDVLITASALLAVSLLGYVRDAADDVISYRAGDMEVRRKADGSSASNLRCQAELLMQPYLSDGDFCFMGVRGL